MKSPGKAMLGRFCFVLVLMVQQNHLFFKKKVRKIILADVQISHHKTGNKKLYRKLKMSKARSVCGEGYKEHKNGYSRFFLEHYNPSN